MRTMPPARTRAQTRLHPGWVSSAMRLKSFARNEWRTASHGAHALAAHGLPRATGDLDVWVNRTRANAQRVLAALTAFGAPL